MVRLVLLVLLLCYFGVGETLAMDPSSVRLVKDDGTHLKKKRKKKKHHKPKKHKSKKHKSGRHKPKGKIYSEKEIEKVLQNDSQEKVCNRLNCASNIEVAKSCLSTKASHRTEKKCFQAFCAYGCNERDYEMKPEVYEFCNLTCSSKKYLGKK